jgi:hypothetical protein
MTASVTSDVAISQAESPRPRLDHQAGIKTILVFLAVIVLRCL